MSEGTVIEWLYDVGDPVKEDDPVAEVEADKVTDLIYAPASGTFSAILVPEGDTVPVLTVLALIEE